MDEITGRWARLSLRAVETDTVELPHIVENNSRVLVAKLLTKRHVNLEALTRTLRSMWRFVQNFEGRYIKTNQKQKPVYCKRLLLYQEPTNSPPQTAK
ncbi:hypothetical protein SO802_009034 [Lithocarpus litseifolius]|uniref:Uncharacterized protein n=1 Tax=Lithocarpus litseifolius TaxID=425828 RepID=A0AAW2DCG0_9ROSI